MQLEASLLSLGPFELRLLHLAVAVNVTVSLLVIYRSGHRRGLPMPGPAVALAVLATCVLATKLLAMAIQLVHFRGYLASYALFRDDGMTILGGIVVSLLVGWLYCRRPNAPPFFALAVPCALGLSVFTIFQRGICFLNGCCFGVPTKSVFGVVFGADTAAGQIFPGTPLHPTQLYTALAYAGLLVLLVFGQRRVDDRALFGVFMILVGAERLINETLRWNANNDVVALWHGSAISGHTAVAAALMAYGVAIVAGAPRRPAEVSTLPPETT